MMSEEPAVTDQVSGKFSFDQKLQYILDKSAPHILYRWIVYGLVLILYLWRVYVANGWFVVTYGLGIYLLNQFIGFLTPQFDPEDGDDDLDLPTTRSEEYRPFARRLPEFKYWLSCMVGTIISLGLTFFSVFDVPVFWPILLVYFFILFFFTMKKQIMHMIKYKYVPWSFGKTVYQSAGTVTAPVKSDK